MKKIIPVVLVLILFIGCAGRHREHGDAPIVRSGVLKQGIDMQAFLDVWGAPDKTRVVTFTEKDDTISARWTRFGGSFLAGKRDKSFQQWDYDSLGISLLFDDEALASWITDKTTAELRRMARPKPQ